MPDFEFRKHPTTGKWLVFAPRRSKRTNMGGSKKPVEVCPFCVGQEANEPEVYRVPARSASQSDAGGGGEAGDSKWQIRVIPNKFPFTPHHEIIIHSPDHHKNIDELPFEQVELLIQTYRHRFHAHKKDGQVYIFHNRGHESGESLPHPHTQIAVVPHHVKLDIPPLDNAVYKDKTALETEEFLVFCPESSDWPDEVWIAPKAKNTSFADITDAQATDLAFTLSRVIQIHDLRHGYEFPFNFYIYPGKNWYLRVIPRLKILGGFELGTNVIVNTQDPRETFAFIKEHFWQPNTEKIKKEHKADYVKKV